MASEFRSPANELGSEPTGNLVNPEGIAGTAAEPAGKVRKPRSDAGKPRGPRTARTKAQATSPLDLSGLAGVLVGLTEAIAQWRDVPEIGLDESEAKELMSASQNVLRHYSVETTQKGADFIALFGCVSMIVGTRIGAYNMRMRVEREQQTRQTFRPTVVPMPQAASPSNQQSQPSATPPVEPVFDEHGNGF